jgi:nitroreductase / dihydropteridine reductase
MLQKRWTQQKLVPPEKLEQILEAIRLSASSSGLQPYEILVVTNKAVREKIRAIASGQSQITDCSYLLVFAAWDNYTAAQRINDAFDMTEEIRNFKSEIRNRLSPKLIQPITLQETLRSISHMQQNRPISV